jgi:hypothetical protein
MDRWLDVPKNPQDMVVTRKFLLALPRMNASRSVLN